MNDIEKAINNFKKRNKGLLNNPVCQDVPERVAKQNYEIKRNLIAISALEKQLNNGWIPVKKKLPDTNKDILVTLNDGKVVPARYLFADNLNHITAWQPLPPAYKEEEKNE